MERRIQYITSAIIPRRFPLERLMLVIQLQFTKVTKLDYGVPLRRRRFPVEFYCRLLSVKRGVTEDDGNDVEIWLKELHLPPAI